MAVKMFTFQYKRLKPSPKTAVLLLLFLSLCLTGCVCVQEGKHLEECSLASKASSFLQLQRILSIAAESRGWK